MNSTISPSFTHAHTRAHNRDICTLTLSHTHKRARTNAHKHTRTCAHANTHTQACTQSVPWGAGLVRDGAQGCLVLQLPLHLRQMPALQLQPGLPLPARTTMPVLMKRNTYTLPHRWVCAGAMYSAPAGPATARACAPSAHTLMHAASTMNMHACCWFARHGLPPQFCTPGGINRCTQAYLPVPCHEAGQTAAVPHHEAVSANRYTRPCAPVPCQEAVPTDTRKRAHLSHAMRSA